MPDLRGFASNLAGRKIIEMTMTMVLPSQDLRPDNIIGPMSFAILICHFSHYAVVVSASEFLLTAQNKCDQRLNGRLPAQMRNVKWYMTNDLVSFCRCFFQQRRLAAA